MFWVQSPRRPRESIIRNLNPSDHCAAAKRRPTPVLRSRAQFEGLYPLASDCHPLLAGSSHRKGLRKPCNICAEVAQAQLPDMSSHECVWIPKDPAPIALDSVGTQRLAFYGKFRGVCVSPNARRVPVRCPRELGEAFWGKC